MLSESVKVTNAAAYASGTADVNGSTLDMAGFDGVLMMVHFAAIATGATTSIKAQGGDESDASDMADLTGTRVSIADSEDNESRYIDLFQPRTRYVRLVIDKDGSNAVGASATYLQYRAKSAPTSHASGVSGEQHASPAAGTA